MTSQQETTPSTQKVRRDELGGKRGQGHRLQEEGKRIDRPDPRRLRQGPPDPTLTTAARLVPFGAVLREEHLDERLRGCLQSLPSPSSSIRGAPTAFLLGHGPRPVPSSRLAVLAARRAGSVRL